MSYPVFASGDVLNASDMNAVGSWLVKTVTVGTGVTSVPVTSCFSADYDNYRITYNGGTGSGSAECTMTLGSTVTGYWNSLIYGVWTATTVPVAVGTGSVASFSVAGALDPNGNYLDLTIMNPFLARRTTVFGGFVGMSSGRVGGSMSGFLADTTSYTGFTLTASGGTNMTGGTIRVYGLRN
jgi:hypothetical protein